MLPILLLALQAASALGGTCDACFDSTCYSKTTIVQDFEILTRLAVERNHNYLYFHIQNKQAPPKHYDVRFDLTRNAADISNRGFTYARAVNQATNDVYISKDKGAIKYNPDTLTETQMPEFVDKTIWQMQYKDKLYYVESGVKGLFYLENGLVKNVELLSNFTIDDFIVDRDDNIFFVDENFSTHLLKKGSNSLRTLSFEILYLTTDRNGVAYFIQSAIRTLHKWDYSKDKFSELGMFTEGLPIESVFDNVNNIIYHDASDERLYYLKPSAKRCNVVRTVRGAGKPRLSVRVIEE